MKNYLIVLILFIFSYCLLQNIEAKDIVIPKESIRLRVIPNSNSLYDQDMKKSIKNILEEKVYSLTNNSVDITDARNIIENNLVYIKQQVEETLEKEGYNIDFDINYGDNYFPQKNYKGIDYEEGKYESLVITLGKGLGDNWWCVLFPPLCLLEAKETDVDEVKYTFLVKEILDKLI